MPMPGSPGVRVLALVLLGWSGWLLKGVASARVLGRDQPLTLAAVALLVLSLLAAAALWGASSRAFSLYTLWGIAAMATLVLLRLHLSGSSHLVRFMPTILVTGLVLAAGAILLRRAI
jgi:hypothetical protein